MFRLSGCVIRVGCVPSETVMEPAQGSRPGWGAVTLGALGVVLGDFGTSPIFTIQTIFNPSDPHPVTATGDSVYGL